MRSALYGVYRWDLKFKLETFNSSLAVLMYPVVDRERCKGCGNCAEICPSEVYGILLHKSNPIHPEDCIECWACVNQCPTESIQLQED